MRKTIKKKTTWFWNFEKKSNNLLEQLNLQENNVITITQNFLWTTLWFWADDVPEDLWEEVEW